ncbi:hypothetical protein G9A89_001444 [Geosiphon pyriformis]|nr:hypothetical protein G9A89_001444 [Geosiphon pyriformis]
MNESGSESYSKENNADLEQRKMNSGNSSDEKSSETSCKENNSDEPRSNNGITNHISGDSVSQSNEPGEMLINIAEETNKPLTETSSNSDIATSPSDLLDFFEDGKNLWRTENQPVSIDGDSQNEKNHNLEEETEAKKISSAEEPINVREQKDHISPLFNQQDKLSHELKSYHTSFKEHQSSCEANREEIKTKIQEQNAFAAKINALFELLQEKQTSEEVNREELKSQVLKLQNNNECLGKELSKAFASNERLEQLIADMKLSIDTMDTRIKEWNSHLQSLETELNSVNNIIGSQGVQVTEVSSHMQAIAQDVAEVDRAIQMLRTSSQEVKESGEVMRKQIEENKNLIMNLQTEVNKIQDAKHEITQKIQDLNSELIRKKVLNDGFRKIELNTADLYKKITKLQKFLEDIDTFNNELNSKVLHLEEKYQEVIKTPQRLAHFEQHLKEIQEESKSFVEEKTRLRNHVQKELGKFDKLVNEVRREINKSIASNNSVQEEFDKKLLIISTRFQKDFDKLCRKVERGEKLNFASMIIICLTLVVFAAVAIYEGA